jgi:murein DD-endopeptidase MepM/ murein hydrolase activator NlpD
MPEISNPQYMAPKLRYADDNAPYKPTKPVLGLGADREIVVSARMTSLARPQIKPVQMDGIGGPLLTSKPREFASVEPTAPVVRTQDHITSLGQPDDFTATNQFIWPVSGKVISSFGQTSNGLVNDGINIAVDAGAGVKASDHGTVIYAGNELPGFGNLLLVKHSNGFVTAYAHNIKLLVKKGAKVRQGQVIANAGKTGNVDRAQVHFEIRRGDKPVDPKRYIESASAKL